MTWKNFFYKKSCSSKQNWQRVFGDMLRNGVCFFLCSTERNSELVSLPQNGLEQNSESLLLFLFHSTLFPPLGTEFREFSVPRNSRNSAGTNQMFRLFHLPRNIFFVGNCQPYFQLQRDEGLKQSMFFLKKESLETKRIDWFMYKPTRYSNL